MRGQRQSRSSSSQLLLLCSLAYTTLASTVTASESSAAGSGNPLFKLDALPISRPTVIPVSLDDMRSLFAVSLPVDNPTKSFWLTPGANPLAEAGSTGELTQEADICIIGSGITGVSTAWHLSNILPDHSNTGLLEKGTEKSKPSIVVLEAREFCSGATGRNGGHLTRNMFYSFLSREAAHNTSEAVRTFRVEQYTAESVVDFIKQRKLDEKVDLVQGGHVTLFSTSDEEKGAREDYEAAKAAGVDVGSKWDRENGLRWLANEELVKNYGLGSGLNWTGASFISHNLWPSKFVTELFNDIQNNNRVNTTLHTKTPVTSIVPLAPAPDEYPSRLFENWDKQAPLSPAPNARRWNLVTPRGDVHCTYVVHGTNAYAGHLLPAVAEKGPFGCSKCSGANKVIIPTRGQVGVVRASVSGPELGWLNSWGGEEGFEYWFPRYQDTKSKPSTDGEITGNEMEADALAEVQQDGLSQNPLIILGGGRQHSGGRLEQGITNDSVVNPRVSRALRKFLPRLFPEQFVSDAARNGEGSDPWEMEWTGIMGYTNTGDPLVGPIGPLLDGCSATESTNGCHSNTEGQYIAAGYSGHGMPRAFACAEAVAGMINADIRGDQWVIPDWLPESYLTTATD